MLNEFLNSWETFSDFDWNGLLLVFSRLIHKFPNSRIFSVGTRDNCIYKKMPNVPDNSYIQKVSWLF